MSKAAKLDSFFNKDEFADLLQEAKGQLTTTEFAKKCGVSFSYICKYLNRNFEKGPTPSTLKKIANFTRTQGITDDQLFLSCGYAAHKYLDLSQYSSDYESFGKIGFGCVLDAIWDHHLQWSNLSPISTSNKYDFDLQISDSVCLTTWLFFFVHVSVNYDELRSYLYSVLGKISTFELNGKTKVSLVLDSPELYNLFLEMKLKSWNCFVSVILINPQKRCFIEEKYVNTNAQIPDELHLKYCLNNDNKLEPDF